MQTWLNWAIEALWLLAVFLVPLAFFGQEYAKSETAIGYVEVPKVALLLTFVGLMAVLCLMDWGLQGASKTGTSISLKNFRPLPDKWLAWLRNATLRQSRRWLMLAVGFYLVTTLLSTALSGSIRISLWGEVPGQDGYSAYTIASYVLLFTVIATHLKTRPQLWRLLSAIVAMGILVGGYAVLQHYEHDFLNSWKPPEEQRATGLLRLWGKQYSPLESTTGGIHRCPHYSSGDGLYGLRQTLGSH